MRDHQIIVCCGAGGVGKTTTAAAIALHAARSGRAAVVVTIDPARRLADALGVSQLGHEPTRIELDDTRTELTTDTPGGTLWALMLDTKRTFDALVRHHAADDEQAERILSNAFYRNISEALSGTQEYMAMEKLYELHESGRFDVVVVDTPPTRNALDFLHAPRLLTRLLDHRLYRLLVHPPTGVGRAVNAATQALLRTLARVVGVAVIDDTVAFFQAFDGMEAGFRDRAQRVHDLLRDDVSGFVLVSSPRLEAVDEAEFFAGELASGGIVVRALIMNRVHPPFGGEPASVVRERAAELRRRKPLIGAALADLEDNLADFRAAAELEDDRIARLAATAFPAPLVRVPFLRDDVHDLDGLDAIGRHLFPPV